MDQEFQNRSNKNLHDQKVEDEVKISSRKMKKEMKVRNLSVKSSW